MKGHTGRVNAVIALRGCRNDHEALIQEQQQSLSSSSSSSSKILEIISADDNGNIRLYTYGSSVDMNDMNGPIGDSNSNSNSNSSSNSNNNSNDNNIKTKKSNRDMFGELGKLQFY